MAIAAFHLLPRNTCWKMHPTISQFNKTSLSPSLPPPSFLCSLPLVPSLWCSPPLRLEFRSTTILKCAQEQKHFREYAFKSSSTIGPKNKNRGTTKKRSEPQGGHPAGPPQKRQKEHPKGGETEESGDVSAVNAGLDLEITGDGEYVLKIIKRTITSEGTTTEVERSKQMAKNTAMIKELLQDMERKLLAQSRAYLIRFITVRKSD